MNPCIGEPLDAELTLRGDAVPAQIRETVLTHADIHAHNTFEHPDIVQLAATRDLSTNGKKFHYTFEPQSVTQLAIDLV